MATANDIIRSALKAVEAVGWDDTVDDQLKADGLEMLNNLLASWSAEGLLVPSITTYNVALTIDQGSYTIGSGGDFNRARPVRIRRAYVRDAQNNDYNVDVVASTDYSEINYKDVTGIPTILYYNDAYPLGTITLYSKPDKAYTLFMDMDDYLSDIALVTDTISLPSEYKRALIYNLALDWVPEHDSDNISLINKIAKDSKKIIQRLNVQPVPTSRFDNAFSNRRMRQYNINID